LARSWYFSCPMWLENCSVGTDFGNPSFSYSQEMWKNLLRNLVRRPRMRCGFTSVSLMIPTPVVLGHILRKCW
jgi:hypothetical protein